MTYKELKEKQQKEVNAFPFGFAFNNKQFEEMMTNFGLKKNDYDKIYSIGAGGYIKKSDAKAMDEMFLRHRQEMQAEIDNDKNGTGFIYQMFEYELANHEYSVTYSLDETLDALGITIEYVNSHKNILNCLKLALKKYEE